MMMASWGDRKGKYNRTLGSAQMHARGLHRLGHGEWAELLQCPGVKPAGMGSMSYTNLLPGRTPSRPRRIELDIGMLRDSVFVLASLCGFYSLSASV
jgi:hypothetical protein